MLSKKDLYDFFLAAVSNFSHCDESRNLIVSISQIAENRFFFSYYSCLPVTKCNKIKLFIQCMFFYINLEPFDGYSIFSAIMSKYL